MQIDRLIQIVFLLLRHENITAKQLAEELCVSTRTIYRDMDFSITPTYDDGIQNDLSLEAIYSGLRMSLASAFNEHEYFSLNDVMAITGESREELLQRIEQCRQELIEAGENPDEYFKPVEPQRAAVYYFPNGLH
jgi:transcriptional antiterminator